MKHFFRSLNSSLLIFTLLISAQLGFSQSSLARGENCAQVFLQERVQAKELWTLLSEKTKGQNQALIDLLSTDPKIEKLYDASAGVAENYTIREHTLMVLELFDQQFPRYKKHFNFKTLKDVRLYETFKFTLALHDIGKSIALKKGNKDRQHEFTTPILKQKLIEQGFNLNETELALALVDHDTIGGFLKDEITINQAIDQLSEMGYQAGMNVQDFAPLSYLFFTADAGSYPRLRQRIFRDDGSILKPENMAYRRLQSMIENLVNLPPSELIIPLRQAVYKMAEFANANNELLPMTIQKNEKLKPDEILFGVPEMAIPFKTAAKAGATFPIAYLKKKQGKLNSQIEYAGLGRQFLLYFKNALFLNQYVNTRQTRDRFFDQKTVLDDQIWFEWDRNKESYELRTKGASEAIAERLLEGKEDLVLYRYGYKEEVKLMKDLLDPKKNQAARAGLEKYLDRSNENNPSWFGAGSIYGYYYTSNKARSDQAKKIFDGPGRVRYKVTIPRETLMTLIKNKQLWIDMEWVDEMNAFTIEALTEFAKSIEPM